MFHFWIIPSYASEIYGSRPIQATPYDRKLATAHFFDFGGTGGSSSSMESLFYVARSFRYASDGQRDYWQSPSETEARRAGDCEDKAIWLYSRLKENGFVDVRLVVGKYRQMDRINHVWITCSDPSGTSYILDPAKQKRPWREGNFATGLYIPAYSFDGQTRYKHSI